MTEDNDRPSNQPVYYYDPYNYSYFQNNGDSQGYTPYPGYYEWDGPGPVTQTRRSNIHVGNTTAGAAIAPNVTIKFVGNKSSGDSKTFAASGICSENLGYFQCSNISPGYYRYSIEGSANVKKASNWTVKQSIVSGRSKGTYNSGSTFNSPTPADDDGPQSGFIQTVDGLPLFWLDSPGSESSYYMVTSGQYDPLFSLTKVDNFSAQVCSTITKSVCGNVTWFTKIVVASGQMTSGSIAGYGSQSTAF